jgi:hypothetical protein
MTARARGYPGNVRIANDGYHVSLCAQLGVQPQTRLGGTGSGASAANTPPGSKNPTASGAAEPPAPAAPPTPPTRAAGATPAAAASLPAALAGVDAGAGTAAAVVEVKVGWVGGMRQSEPAQAPALLPGLVHSSSYIVVSE